MRRRLPGPNEIEIEVAATGLNFRDVMWAMGLLPEEALEEGFAGPTLGMECSGVITAVGEGVTGMQTGMRVLAFAPACFSSHVTVSTRAVAPIPGDLSFEEAATIPSTFFTAYYALLHLAQIEPGSGFFYTVAPVASVSQPCRSPSGAALKSSPPPALRKSVPCCASWAPIMCSIPEALSSPTRSWRSPKAKVSMLS